MSAAKSGDTLAAWCDIRNFLAGGTSFFTVALLDRRSNVLTEHITSLRAAFHTTRQTHPFKIEAAVVLPEHLHVLMTLPEDDADFSNRWSLIKRRFTRAVMWTNPSLARRRNGEVALWQRRFWERTIRDGNDFERHVDYIHFNPVKHRLVAPVRDWPHSSFHRYVRNGLLPKDWAGDFSEDIAGFGEPAR